MLALAATSLQTLALTTCFTASAHMMLLGFTAVAASTALCSDSGSALVTVSVVLLLLLLLLTTQGAADEPSLSPSINWA